jgi:hypothetical protein
MALFLLTPMDSGTAPTVGRGTATGYRTLVLLRGLHRKHNVHGEAAMGLTSYERCPAMSFRPRSGFSRLTASSISSLTSRAELETRVEDDDDDVRGERRR